MSHIVSIIGRPNVGKSTLFNRLVGNPIAIMDNEAGVTRDRHYGKVEWNSKEFDLIDTGGFMPHSKDFFDKKIAEQVQIAIDESNTILFIVDAQTGVTQYDESILEVFKKKKVENLILVVNKVDNYQLQLEANAFYSFAIDSTFFIASISGSGTGELLDMITKNIKDEKPNDEFSDNNVPKIAIIGKPNVGKSSFVNCLLEKERTIVSEIEGTTRDSIHTLFEKFQKKIILIDTAGLRKKNKIKNDLEYYSTVRTIRSIDESDVCLLLIDSTEGVQAQDLAIYTQIIKKGKGVVIVGNKWDLIEKSTMSSKEYEDRWRKKLEPFSDIPIHFISVLQKTRVLKTLEIAEEVYNLRKQKITTSNLNKFLKNAIIKMQPPVVRGMPISINYITQLATASTPSFLLFCNHPNDIKESYKKFLENQFRQEFNFKGVPIRFFFRKKN